MSSDGFNSWIKQGPEIPLTELKQEKINDMHKTFVVALEPENYQADLNLSPIHKKLGSGSASLA